MYSHMSAQTVDTPHLQVALGGLQTEPRSGSGGGGSVPNPSLWPQATSPDAMGFPAHTEFLIASDTSSTPLPSSLF